MSFTILKEDNLSFLSKAASDYLIKNYVWITPSEQHISELPLPTDLEIKPVFLHSDYTAVLDAIINFEVRSDDVFVCSQVKCGSSWMQSIVWLLTHDLDYTTIGSVDRDKLMYNFDHMIQQEEIIKRARQLVANDQTKSLDEKAAVSLEWNKIHANLQPRRVIKSNFQPYFLPKGIWSSGAKIIYVVRNPKDMAVSSYHFFRNLENVDLTLDDAINGIINDKWFYSPFLGNALNFWKLKHLPNVFIVAYEDLVNDSFATMKKISEFLGYCYSDDQLDDLTRFISFENMKNICTINREKYLLEAEKSHGERRLDPEFRFLRKGKVGSYVDDLNEDQIQKLDEYIDKVLQDSDFKFKS